MALPSPNALHFLRSLEDKYYKQYGLDKNLVRTDELVEYKHAFTIVSVQTFYFPPLNKENVEDTIDR